MLRPSNRQRLTQRIDRRAALALRLTALLLVAVVAGCSTVRLAYERLDLIARWQANRYVSFTPAQRTRFDAGFAEIWRWHRQHELPLWTGELRRLAARTETLDTVDRAQLAQMSERYGRMLKRTTGQLAALACTLGPSLSEEQTEELLATVDEDVAEFREEHVERSAERRRKDALAALEKPLRRWIGRLHEDQRELLRQWNDARPSVAQDWLDYRGRWRAELAATLAQRHGPDFCPRIERLIVRGSELWTDTQKQTFAADRERWLDLFAALLPTLDARQREHLRQRLLTLAEDLDAAAQPRTTAAARAALPPG